MKGCLFPRLAFLSAALAAMAAGAPAPPVIYSAYIDFSKTPPQLYLTGNNFSPFGGLPVVTLDGTPLIINSGTGTGYNDTSIDATMPSQSFSAGDYGVTVTAGTQTSGTFSVTIGAVGPAGPAGPAGPTGAAGPAGPTGPTGPSGAQGPVGPQGPTGAQGMTWKGAWSSTTTYNLNDSVSFQDSSFISIVPHNLGNLPVTPGYWNLLAREGQNGPAGPTGAQGPSGPAGPQGSQGPAGPTGATGAQGPVGPAGMTWKSAWSTATTYNLDDAVSFGGASYISLSANNVGHEPDKSPSAWSLLAQAGAQGATGPQGAQGPQGVTGATGAQGPAGPQGATGATGAQGPQGATGATGAQGPQGPQGATGATGAQGPVGPAGMTWKSAWSTATTYNLDDAVSFAGASYISLSANNVGHEPDKSPSAWSLLAQAGAQGATGPQGPQGTTGATGAQGPQGPQGSAGATGAQGPTGPAGLTWQSAWSTTTTYNLDDAVSFGGASYISLIASNVGHEPDKSPSAWSLLAQAGAQGATGPQGPQGATGATGAQGPAGPQGATGSTGAQGPAGPQGATGSTGAQGPAGPTGPAGAQGPVGPAGLTWQSAWSITTTYNQDDAVSYGGASYISLGSNNTGHEPDKSPGAWSLLAQQGTQGPAGPTGPVGIVWQSAWSSATTYNLGDAVSYSGASYISLGPNNFGHEPDKSPGAWGLLAQAGAQGGTGPAGPQGPQGPAGAQGPKGATGAQGPIGPAGLTWQSAWSSTTSYNLNDAVSYGGSSYISLGPNNLNHEPDKSPGSWSLVAQVGATGPAGPQGSTGATGPQGPVGATGPAGPTGPTGSQGPSGTNGNTVWNGTTPPPGATGVNGDFYLNTATNCLYGPKASNVWPTTCVTLVGPQGPQGALGPQGPAGSTGPQGATGPAGPTGAAGPAGPAGPAGMAWRAAWSSATTYNLNDAVSFNGSSYLSLVANNTNNEPDVSPGAWSLLAQQGAQGPAGPQGASGPAGPQGPQGTAGSAGPAGPQGPQGNVGPQGPAGAPGPPTILSGFCGTGTLLSLGAATGVLLQLGSEDISQPSCFNGYTPAAVVGLPVPSAGTLLNLTVASNLNGAYPVSVNVYINGVITSIGCTITTSACTDNQDSASVQPGDRVAVQLSASSVPLGQLSVHASLEKQ